MDALQQLSISLIQALQTLSPSLDGVMNLFSFLGRAEFYLLTAPFIYWAYDKRLGIQALLILLAIDVVSASFKLLFHQPRPYWIGGVQALAEEASYGIPSSHASDSLAIGGYLAYRVKKTWFSVVIGIILFFIGLSRLYLGVHFLHDVLFGWLLGAIILWIASMRAEQIACLGKIKNIIRPNSNWICPFWNRHRSGDTDPLHHLRDAGSRLVEQLLNGRAARSHTLSRWQGHCSVRSQAMH